MRMCYTGPFGPMARHVWVQRAKELIAAGKEQSFLFILPTATLLKDVRDQLLEETGGISELNILAFDDIAHELVTYADPFVQMLTNYELHRFYDRFLEETFETYPWQAVQGQELTSEVKQTIIRTISEIKRSGMTTDQAQSIVSSANYHSKHRALAHLVIRSDQELTQLSAEKGYTCLTYEARLEKASRMLEDPGQKLPLWLQKVDTIWVDHFTDFFPLQFRLLSGLMNLDSVDQAGVYFPYQLELMKEKSSKLFAARSKKRRGGLAELAAETLSQLQLKLDFKRVDLDALDYESIQSTIATDWGIMPSHIHTNSPVDELWALPQLAFGKKDATLQPPQSFEMIPCSSEKKEIEVVAKQIKQRLLTENGLRPKDIAIIVRDKEHVTTELLRRFHQEEIPINLHQNQKLSDIPLFQQLNALLHLVTSNWSRDTLVILSEGTYLVWNHPPTSSFVRWAKERGVREGEQIWFNAIIRDREFLEQKRREIVESEDEEVDPKVQHARIDKQQTDLLYNELWLEELANFVRLFSEWATFDGHIASLQRFLNKCDFGRQLISMLQQNNSYRLEWFKRDLECVKIIDRSLEQLWRSVEKLGEWDRRVHFRQFLSEWEEQWQEETIQIARGNPSGVVCLEPTASRGMSYEHVYILGCNEGVFPLKSREQWFLDDTERLLIQENATLAASHYHYDMEKTFFIMGVAAARTQLTFTFISPKTIEDMLPSSFLEAILKKIPDGWLEEQSKNQVEALSKKSYAVDTDEISSVQEYGLWLMARSTEPNDDASELFEQEWMPPQMSMILRGAWIEQSRKNGPYSVWDGFIQSRPAIQELQRTFASETSVFSISQINEYMSSPLTFFFRRVLRVFPEEEYGLEVSPLDKGLIQHEALRQFYLRHKGESLSLDQLEMLQVELGNDVQHEAKKFAEGTPYERSTIWHLETTRLAAVLEDWLEKELISREKASPGIVPVHFEFSFGMNIDKEQVDTASIEDVIEIELAQERLKLRGKIDRIDIDREGNFAIFDYKSSLARYKNYRELTDGATTYQLPIYLRAISEWLKTQGIDTPQMIGAAFYSIGASDGGKKHGLWDKERKSLLGVTNRTRSYPIEQQIEEDLRVVEEGLNRLRAGRFYLTPDTRPNPYYADNALYRYDAIDIKQKDKKGGATSDER